MIKELDQNLWKMPNVHSISKEDVRESELWKQMGPSPGIYFFVSHQGINYPFAHSKIVYIGKSKNLERRMLGHFRFDTRIELLDGKETRAWCYLNYYWKGIPFDIMWTHYSAEQIDDFERLFIGLFTAKFGAPPLCNGSIQRKKLKETYKEWRNSRNVKEMERILLKIDEKHTDGTR